MNAGRSMKSLTTGLLGEDRFRVSGNVENLGVRVAAKDNMFELYKKRVYEKIKEIDQSIIPASWWETVIKYYYNSGYSEDQAAHTVLETMAKK